MSLYDIISTYAWVLIWLQTNPVSIMDNISSLHNTQIFTKLNRRQKESGAPPDTTVKVCMYICASFEKMKAMTNREMGYVDLQLLM